MYSQSVIVANQTKVSLLYNPEGLFCNNNQQIVHYSLLNK